MEAMRQSWSDDRLDDLSGRVDAGFARLEQRIDASEERLNRRIDTVEERLHRRIDESARDTRLEFSTRCNGLETRFDQLEARFDRMQQTIMITGGGIVATLIATCVAALVG